MPSLEQLGLVLPESPVNPVVELLLQGFRDVKTPIGQPLLISAGLSTESALADALNTEHVHADSCPCLFLFGGQDLFQVNNAQGVALMQDVQLNAYVIFYTSGSENNFETNRRSFIRLLIAGIQNKAQSGTQYGMTYSIPALFRMQEQTITVDYDTPFKYLNRSINLGTNFTAARIEFTITQIRNWVREDGT